MNMKLWSGQEIGCKMLRKKPFAPHRSHIKGTLDPPKPERNGLNMWKHRPRRGVMSLSMIVERFVELLAASAVDPLIRSLRKRRW